MVAIVVLSVGALAAVIFTNRSPLLGLDLQGGISVVLEPYVDGKPAEDVSDEQVEQAIAIIRSRIDTLGVSEPEISSQGNSILIQLPGIDDQERLGAGRAHRPARVPPGAVQHPRGAAGSQA